ncbi:hypothetical protein AXG93_3911s1420 [Marchantia polymorpha subsp. ruderalis]|uniref:Uncharacterized protein n=1 Tax=Marchantia polymorpha subsp. ruderalis TaxID=1480154 RepID=A0A176W344_MARPO|nr:hypothetical protein AXG93_3911s1420 [Marchantia polymorpha subsp. ruderalis]
MCFSGQNKERDSRVVGFARDGLFEHLSMEVVDGNHQRRRQHAIAYFTNRTNVELNTRGSVGSRANNELNRRAAAIHDTCVSIVKSLMTARFGDTRKEGRKEGLSFTSDPPGPCPNRRWAQ